MTRPGTRAFRLGLLLGGILGVVCGHVLTRWLSEPAPKKVLPLHTSESMRRPEVQPESFRDVPDDAPVSSPVTESEKESEPSSLEPNEKAPGAEESTRPEILEARIYDVNNELLRRGPAVLIAELDLGVLHGVETPMVLLPPGLLASAEGVEIFRGAKRLTGVVRVILGASEPGFVLCAVEPVDGAAARLRENVMDSDKVQILGTQGTLRQVPFQGLKLDNRAKHYTLSVPVLRSPALALDADGRLVGVNSEETDHPGQWTFYYFDLSSLRGLSRMDMSLADYRKLIDPSGARDFLETARKAIREGRLSDAVDGFRLAMAARAEFLPRDFESWEGALVRLDQEFSAAPNTERIPFYQAALRDFPGRVEWWVNLAQLFERIREFGGALSAYEEAERRSPGHLGDFRLVVARLFLTSARDLLKTGLTVAARDETVRGLGRVPDSADLWRENGELEFSLREFAAAGAAFRRAAALDPPDAADLLRAAEHAEKLAAGPGKVVIDYSPGGRVILAQVEINGRVGEFIIDTGAQSTMIPESLARRAGLDTGPNVPRVRVLTAGGERVLPYSPAESIRLGPLNLSGASVIVGNLTGQGDRGLLGMDFLGAFAFENDARVGRFVIYRR